jgi:hypothetical protein
MSNASLSPDELRLHVTRMVNSEIDILVEDADYFLFVEAKIPTAGHRTAFSILSGVHQLVRQYVQGKILEKIIGKTFALATIGPNNAEPIKIIPNLTEKMLLRLVGEERELLDILDLPWSLLTTTEAHGD